jgi:hypothetical protein
MFFLKSWHFLTRQLSISVAKSTATTAAFGEGRNHKKSGNMKKTPQNSMYGVPSGSHALSALPFFNKATVNGECYRAVLQISPSLHHDS